MRKFVGSVLGIAAAVCLFLALLQIGSPTGPVVQSQMSSVEDSVADDAVVQYNITARSGTQMDKCVHAGMVAAAFLQAKNEDKYAAWKNIEKVDCQRAGIPSY